MARSISMVETIRLVDSEHWDFWYNSGITAVKYPARNVTTEFNTKTGTSFCKGAYDKMLYELPELQLKQIDSVYVGKPHACMCGCSGQYYYTKEGQAAAGKKRGYPVCDEDVNNAKVQRVINKIRKNQSRGIEVIQDYIFTAYIGSQQYTIFMGEII
jgi:hypothetical protein